MVARRRIKGREVVVAVTEDQLVFGTGEQIFCGEFDGRRMKRVLVKIIGEWMKLASVVQVQPLFGLAARQHTDRALDRLLRHENQVTAASRAS